MQVRATHELPAPQLIPHAPQFVESTSMLRHCPPQLTLGGTQVTEGAHTPAEQVIPDGHTLPQRLQLDGSRRVSTHEAPQSVRPVSH